MRTLLFIFCDKGLHVCIYLNLLFGFDCNVTNCSKLKAVRYLLILYSVVASYTRAAVARGVNPFNASCSKLLLFEGLSAILV